MAFRINRHYSDYSDDAQAKTKWEVRIKGFDRISVVHWGGKLFFFFLIPILKMISQLCSRCHCGLRSFSILIWLKSWCEGDPLHFHSNWTKWRQRRESENKVEKEGTVKVTARADLIEDPLREEHFLLSLALLIH